MTVDEKITRLQESAMQEARSKGNAIVEQHKKALTHVFEQHKAEALIQADTRIKAEKTSVKQQLGMANSKAALELKRELGAAQKRLKKQLFKEVEEKLSAYMKTEKYQDLLVKYIEKAVAYSDRGEMTIYVNPTESVSGGEDRIYTEYQQRRLYRWNPCSHSREKYSGRLCI